MKLIPLLLCLQSLAIAQFYIVSTVAGNGRLVFNSGSAAINALLIQPVQAASDSAGNVYVSDQYYHQIFKVTADGIIAAYAGSGRPGFGGDGGPATAAQLSNPNGIAVDAAGNLYIADGGNARVRRVSPSGTISTVAGNGQGGVSGDGGPATSAAVSNPSAVAVDAAGNLFISQTSFHLIRQVRSNGAIASYAGTGIAGFSGDGGPGTAARLSGPQGLGVDALGNLYVADSQNHRIRKITPQGSISTVAGNGKAALSGNGGAATLASLSIPAGVAADASGNLYIGDTGNARVRMVNSSGVISDFAGQGTSLKDGPVNQSRLLSPTGVNVDSKGNVLIVLFSGHQVRRVTQGTITSIAGATPPTIVGENTSATATALFDPRGIAVDPLGNLYVSDTIDHRIRKISAAGTITTYAGNGLYGITGDGGLAVSAEVGSPRGLTLDQGGNLYATIGFGSATRQIAASGLITTVAGGGIAGFAGDGGKATAAQFLVPFGIAKDAAGNIYIADTDNNRIRRVDTSGIVTTIAGSGTDGFAGDGGPATAASLSQPRQLALDSNGNLYLADTGNNRIRKITPAGVISTIAGNGTTGAGGDGGAATDAQLTSPSGVALDASGNMYISTAARIRRVEASTGKMTTIAGTGGAGFGGDGGLGTAAQVSSATNLAVDRSGNVYFTDNDNLRVRKLTLAQIVPQAVVNGATFKAGAVAPGEIVTFFGSDLGPTPGVGLQLDSNGRVTKELAGTQVLFDGVPAPMIFVLNSQVNVVVPYAVAGNTSTEVQAIVQGKPTNTITLPVAASSPGVFAITNQDGTVNSASNAAARGGVLVLYATGEGQTDPPGVDGNVANSVYPKPNLSVFVQIGGQTANVQYAGAAPGFVSGVLQVNVQIPGDLSGTLPLQLQIGTATTPAGLTVSVR